MAFFENPTFIGISAVTVVGWFYLSMRVIVSNLKSEVERLSNRVESLEKDNSKQDKIITRLNRIILGGYRCAHFETCEIIKLYEEKNSEEDHCQN